MGVTLGSFWGQPTARLTPSTRKNHLEVAKNVETPFEHVYCPHNGVLCREEDLTLSAVCSTCAQAHLAQIHLAQDLLSNSTKDEVESSSSTTSSSSSSMSSSIASKKSKSKRTVTFMPLLPDDAHQAEVAEE